MRSNNNSFDRSESDYQQQRSTNRNFQSQLRVYLNDDDKKNEENNSFNQETYQAKYYYKNQNDTMYEYSNSENVYQNNYNLKSSAVENSHSFFVDTSTKQARIFICQRCNVEFYFNNKLHKHIKTCKKKIISVSVFSEDESINVFNAFIIHFDASTDNNSDLNFRIWHYVIFVVSIDKSDNLHEVCSDIDCDVSLINRAFLIAEVSNYQQRVQKKIDALRIKNIDDALFNTMKHLLLIFRIFEKTINDFAIIICFIRHVYIVNELKIKMLIINDILESKFMMSNVDREKLIIDNCKNIIVKLNVKNADFLMKRMIRFSNVTKISTRFSITISFKLRDKDSLSTNRDFMFTTQRIDRLKIVDDVFFHIVDTYISIVQIMNVSIENVFIFKNNKLDIIQEYEKENCFLVNQENVDLTANFDSYRSTSFASRNWFKKTMKTEIAIMTADVAIYQIIIKFIVSSFIKKLATQAEIIVYNETSIIQIQLVDVAEFYSQL